MRKEDIQAVGAIILVIGLFIFIRATTPIVADKLAVSMAMFPMSVKPPSDKISPLLKEKIQQNPNAKIPVVIQLTAPPATGMAVEQQQAIMHTLQIAGFSMSLSIVNVDNALAGTVPAKNVTKIASSPYVRQVLYDGMLFKLTSDVPSFKNLDWNDRLIGAEKVWAEGDTGQGVTVIIIDSGVQPNNPYLMRDGESLVLKEIDIVPGAHGYTTIHGTHCAGIIASQDSKYRGVAPGIKGFVSILAFNKEGQAKLSWILKALDEAYQIAQQDKPCVCTNSWGSMPANTSELNAVREAAMKLASVCPTVFAAGNFGPNSRTIACPGDADNGVNEVITVGAVNANDQIAWFSSRGPDTWGEIHKEPNVVAPGVDVVSTTPYGFKALSGTSMATPHVAGVIALMLAKDPALTNEQALKILEKTAKDLGNKGFDYAYGYGLVQAYQAVQDTPKVNPIVAKVQHVNNQNVVVGAILTLTGSILLIRPELLG